MILMIMMTTYNNFSTELDHPTGNGYNEVCLPQVDHFAKIVDNISSYNNQDTSVVHQQRSCTMIRTQIPPKTKDPDFLSPTKTNP